jgi:hypothetical protein
VSDTTYCLAMRGGKRVGTGAGNHEAGMQGLRKLLRAVAIVFFPALGVAMIYTGSSREEVIVGVALVFFACGLIATWFWSPW